MPNTIIPDPDEQEVPETIQVKEVERINTLQPIYSDSDISSSEIDVEMILDRAEKHLKVEKRIREIAIGVTTPNDWIDEGGKPYLMWTGAARIARILGVSYFDLKYEDHILTDEKGEYLISEVKGKIKWKGGTIEEVGTSHSRKPLLAMRKNKATGETYLLPLSEIDRTNVRKMAHTNFLNRGLKSMVGLNFTWEEVTEFTGAKPENSGGKVDFKKKEKNLDDPRRKEIADMLVEMHGKSATVTLQAMTTFQANGKTVPGKQKVSDLTDPQVERLYPQVKKLHDEWKKKQKFINDGVKEGEKA